MIGDPMKRRGAENAVDGGADDFETDRLQIALKIRHAITESRGEICPRLIQHILRSVKGDQSTLRQPLEHLAAEPASSTPGIENRLVAAKHQSVDDTGAPRHVRLRDT